MPHWLTRNGWRWLVVTGLVSLLAFAAACGDDDDDDDDDASPTEEASDGASPTDGDEPSGEVEALIAPFFPQSGRVILREAIEQDIIDQFIFTDGTKSQAMFDEIGVEPFEGMYGTQPGAPER